MPPWLLIILKGLACGEREGERRSGSYEGSAIAHLGLFLLTEFSADGLFRCLQRSPSLLKIVEEGPARRKDRGAAPKRLRPRVLGQEQCNQRDRRRQRLYDQNACADGRRTVSAGHDHTDQEEYLDLEREGRVAVNEAPNQAGNQKTVIEPLIGGQYFRDFSLLRRIAKDLQALRLVPEEHLQDQEVGVQCGDQRHQDIGDQNQVEPPKRQLSGGR